MCDACAFEVIITNEQGATSSAHDRKGSARICNTLLVGSGTWPGNSSPKLRWLIECDTCIQPIANCQGLSTEQELNQRIAQQQKQADKVNHRHGISLGGHSR